MGGMGVDEINGANGINGISIIINYHLPLRKAFA